MMKHAGMWVVILSAVLSITQPSIGQETQSETAQKSDEQKSVQESAHKQQRPAPSLPLVDAPTLMQMMDEPDVRILDVRTKKQEYDAGHIPGAMFVHWIDDITTPNRKDRYNLIEADGMERLLRRLGISNSDRIVLYDNLSSRLATRLLWSLKVYGHEKVLVLDGGRTAWAGAGYKFTTEVKESKPGTYRIGKADTSISANLKFIEQHLNDPNVTLVDGRPPAQFSGKEPGRVFHTGKAHKQLGHVPGALHIFWKDNFNPDGTFKSVKELRALYKKRGVALGGTNTTVTYCNEGLHAAPAWFVLHELLGNKDVRVYDDSMSEWANSGQPMETGPADQPNAKQEK